MRVDVPTNKDDLVKLGKAIKDKHVALGAASPLSGIEDFDKFAGLVDTAATQHDQSKEFARKSEAATQLADKALGQTGQVRENTVRWFVTAARDLLLATNKGKEQKLGDWSFTVDASAQSTSQPAKAKT